MERTFDPWQQEAIAISGGRHLVLAPPGCGKTDILTERVVHAHECGVDYGDMLCLTFTNRAAKGMAQRIADRTGNPVPDDLYVGNIHRYCSQMLFKEGLVSHNSAIIDEGDVDSIVQEELCKRLDIKSHTTELMRLQHGLWQMTLGMRGDLILHGDMFRAGSITRLCDVLGRPHDEENLAYIYANIDELFDRYSVLRELPAANMMLLAHAYQQYKTDNDLLDYDDLLVLAYNYLVNSGEWGVDSSRGQAPPTTHSSLTTKRYRWIEVDEVQDLNSLQFALIDLLATDDATVVYLGDEQQAIFSFIGAKMETLEALKRRCAGHIHHLHTNYRSPRYLLDMQNDYAVANLGLSREMLPTNDKDVEHAPEDLCMLNVGEASLESYYAARFARRYGETSGPEAKVAILVSTNREADDISEVMNGMGVSHFKISGTDLFSTPTVRLLTAHMSVLCDETVFIAWARLLWGLHITPTYTAARTMMREMRREALLPTDFLMYDDSSYLQQFVHAYDNDDLVIFDTETTGLDTDTDDIIQIAAITMRHGEVVGRPFNIIIETDRELPETVGGHINPMLEVYHNSHRHQRAEGLRMFMDYCKGKILVGHNVNYDYRILDSNLRRSCPDIDLARLCPTCFDTLKYIRLVRPRLRNYKLGHLLEALHLEGQNSHQADDDIMATLELLRYCHTAAQPMAARQRLYASDNRRQIARFRERYMELYKHGLHADGTLMDELDYAYRSLLDRGLIEPVDKWRHLLRYLECDLVRTDLYPTLRRQLERYTTDLCTCKEADMCGSSLEERYIISTVHKAKGLEFDTVIVYRAIDGSYPGQRSWTEKQIQEDARRLFVALSRSRRRLCIIYDDHYGRSVHTLSPFLEKVKSHFTIYHRSSDGKIRAV
ncbi:MAG: UvrD-helicase domain-containing protein [Bacteroidales bacterium]|nr:UvrD-helicase domain-containing protein [Bacteroidales bacterium]